MSVRVNLLPEATKQRDRAAQQRSIAALVGVALLAVLGGFQFWASAQVSAAEDDLLAAQARSAELRGEQAELVAFQELADRRDRSDGILSAALSSEVSAAGVLQDLAAVLPNDTQLDSLSISLTPAQDPADPTMGSFDISGKTLTSHAPGVERVLISLDKVASFRGLYLNSSSLDEEDGRIATFALVGQIGPEAATGRYDAGLPEDLR